MTEVDFGHGFKVVVVDLHKDSRKLPECAKQFPVIHTAPKPTVWQGPYRLTKSDYFAMANARNTALCLAQDGWIVYVDDCSVLMPGWLDAITQATKRDRTITLGAYRKVFELQVENGLVKSYKPNLLGVDTRNRRGREGLIMCRGEWHYGCSLIAPVESYLSVNGWDENCDGMGYEDVVTGALLENAGWNFIYDWSMMTYESEELHHDEFPMKRIDKGISPRDKSHAILNSIRMRKWAPNYFGEEGISGLRQRILKGESFPKIMIPENDWFDGQPLSEM